MTGAARVRCGWLTGMRIVRLDVSDQAAAQACHDVMQAALAADDPLGPPVSVRSMRAWLGQHGVSGETWSVPGETEFDALGWYHLMLPAPERRSPFVPDRYPVCLTPGGSSSSARSRPAT
jgi:hypothetical protein